MRRASVFRIFISVVATLWEYLSSYTSQTSAHIYTGFFSFKYTYTGKWGWGGWGGGEEAQKYTVELKAEGSQR